MAVPVAALAKIAAAALSDEDSRKRLGWIVAAICSPSVSYTHLTLPTNSRV